MKKAFDAVAFMRSRREELSREYEGLSWEEQSRKMAEALRDDPIYRRLKHRVFEHGATRQAAVRERQEQDYSGSDDKG